MKRIWAPWRMAYVSNAEPSDGCIFCRAWECDDDRQRLVLVRSRSTMVMMNRYPYTGGHLMVAPVRHVPDMDGLGDEELLDLMHCLRKSHALLNRAVHPDGCNVGINYGKAAGAGIDDHLHIHIVPRWNGDTNFMTVTGGVRVIPQALMDAYDHLAAAIKTGW